VGLSEAPQGFGMIILERYGGLGFSGYAEMARRPSACSFIAGVIVMVPHSHIPGELLPRFGTAAQNEQILPRLADWREISSFARIGEEAGSDPAAMRGRGLVCQGLHEGRRMLGLRVTGVKPVLRNLHTTEGVSDAR
jgi:acyl-CoA dehydrogenase